MSTFKTTLKVLLAQRLVIIIYVVALCAMMFALSWSSVADLANADRSTKYEAARPEVALVNHDGKDGEQLAAPMRDFLAKDCDLVQVGTTSEALQQAAASNYVDLIVVIPEGFMNHFAQAIANGDAMPQLNVTTSFTGSYGTLARLDVEDFLRLVRIETAGVIATHTASSNVAALGDAAQHVASTLTTNTQAFPTVAVAPNKHAADSRDDAARISFVSTLKFGCYPIITAMLICTALALNVFGGSNIRRRLYASPTHTASMMLQECGACALFSMVVGVLYFGAALLLPAIAGLPLNGIPSTTLLLGFITLLIYGFVGVAAGFMLSMLALNAVAVNGFGNVFGLLLMFTSGCAFPIDMMPSVMIEIGKLMPGWWYCQAIDAISSTNSVIDLSHWWAALGIIALFGLAFVCLGLLFSHYRRTHPRLTAPTTTQLAEA